MTLLDRLLGLQPDPETRIPVHEFMAGVSEYKRGAVTRAQVKTAFNLSVDEGTQLDVWLDNFDADTLNRALVHDVLLLGSGRDENNVPFYPKATVRTRLNVGT